MSVIVMTTLFTKHWYHKEEFDADRFYGLMGLCDRDTAVLGQFCAKNITNRLFPFSSGNSTWSHNIFLVISAA